MEVADDQEAFKAFVKISYDESEPEEVYLHEDWWTNMKGEIDEEDEDKEPEDLGLPSSPQTNVSSSR